MYLLTISSFFRTVLIIIVVIYGAKLFIRHILPLMIENKVNEMKKRQNGLSEQEAEHLKKQEGKIKISQNPSKDGEYVEYEEVK